MAVDKQFKPCIVRPFLSVAEKFPVWGQNFLQQRVSAAISFAIHKVMGKEFIITSKLGSLFVNEGNMVT